LIIITYFLAVVVLFPVVMATNRFLFKDKIGCRLIRASNVKMQLLGYIGWQWDRYLVAQNVFLV